MNFKSSLIKILVIILLLIQPFGNLLRVNHAQLQTEVFGLQTIITGCIIVLGFIFGYFYRGIRDYKAFLAYILFTILGSLMTFIDPQTTHLTLRVFLQNIYYITLAIIISNLKFSFNELKLIGITYTLSFCFIAVLSLLDFKNILNIPGFNLAMGSREIVGEYAMRMSNLSGPFTTRTTFGNYSAVAMGSAIGALFMTSLFKNKLLNAFCLIAVAINFIAALQSLSRGLILSFIFAFIYILYTNLVAFKESLKIFLPIILLGFFGSAFLFLFKDYFYILLNFTNSLSFTEASHDISSSFRFRVWLENLTSIRVWIMGKGFSPTYIAESYGGRDAHNTFITLFRVLGLPGIILLIFTFKKPVKYMLKCNNPVALPFVCGIISYLAYGLTHTAWNFAVFWIFIGITINLCKNHYHQPDRRYRP